MRRFQKDFFVRQDLSAAAMGSGDLKVLATPAVLAFAEETCKDLISGELNAGETTVGTKVELKHLRPSKLGVTITVEACLLERTKNILKYEFSVFEGGQVIAEGCHQRAVVEQERFLRQLDESQKFVK